MNELAFPRDNSLPDQSGMTLRDYFAAKAMQGMFASQGNMLVVTKEYLAKTSYEYADAMMKARTE
jgi:type IV secretory pathway TraG/TraD family ATPase VirD4